MFFSKYVLDDNIIDGKKRSKFTEILTVFCGHFHEGGEKEARWYLFNLFNSLSNWDVKRMVKILLKRYVNSFEFIGDSTLEYKID